MRVIFINWARLKANLILACGILGAATFLGLAVVRPEPLTRPTAGKVGAIYRVKTDQPAVALTFDISWGTQTPPPVMDILKTHNVKATFFLSGPWVRRYPELARRLADEGHEIGSHGHRHINLSREARETVAEEIRLAHQAIREVTGREANLIRTPNGDFDQMVVEVAAGEGYRVIQWSVDSLDWMNPGVEAITNRVLRLAHPGAIILMHASDTCKQTTAALPAVIAGLQQKGFRLVTVSELLAMGEPLYE